MFAFYIPVPFTGTCRQIVGISEHTGIANLLKGVYKLVSEPRNANTCGHNMLAAAQCGFRWEAGVLHNYFFESTDQTRV